MKKLSSIIILVLTLTSCASSRYGETTGQYVDSSAISAKIKTKLLSTEGVSGTSINVESFKNTVILSGFVDSEAEKEMALTIAKSIKGVQKVNQALIVKSKI